MATGSMNLDEFIRNSYKPRTNFVPIHMNFIQIQPHRCQDTATMHPLHPSMHPMPKANIVLVHDASLHRYLAASEPPCRVYKCCVLVRGLSCCTTHVSLYTFRPLPMLCPLDHIPPVRRQASTMCWLSLTNSTPRLPRSRLRAPLLRNIHFSLQ